MVDGDTLQVKFECKKDDPPAKTAELYTFRLITPDSFVTLKCSKTTYSDLF